MIRVVLRHIDYAEGLLIGDFPPSEIPALIDLLVRTRIVFSDEADDCRLSPDLRHQIIQFETEKSTRAVMEILLVD